MPSASAASTAVEPASGFTISDLARDFGVTLRTLRFYESRGLLSPARSGMTRIYSGRDRARLALILKGKQLGFTLVEIRAMLANEERKQNGEASASVGGLQLSRNQIAEQLELLRSQQSEIESAIAELRGDAAPARPQLIEARIPRRSEAMQAPDLGPGPFSCASGGCRATLLRQAAATKMTSPLPNPMAIVYM